MKRKSVQQIQARMAASNITNEIIITAMDRFVWFVLLVVMSHLVTEFTRVTGYARGNRHDVVLVNDSFILPKVANMIFYPGEEYSLYDHQVSQYNNIYPNTNNNYNSNNNNPNSAVITGPTNANTMATGFPFSFRPIIDSIFEIPISTLRAVNNLVARLTGSYQHQVPGKMTSGTHKFTNNNKNDINVSPEKLQAFRSLPYDAINEATSTTASESLSSATATQEDARNSNTNNNNNNNNSNSSNDKNSNGRQTEIRMRRSLLREVNA